MHHAAAPLRSVPQSVPGASGVIQYSSDTGLNEDSLNSFSKSIYWSMLSPVLSSGLKGMIDSCL